MNPLRLAALATGLAYLVWRLAFTWSGANPALFATLLAAEAIGIVRLGIEFRTTGTPRRVEWDPATVDPPPTDICVVVNDEPASEARAAVLSARMVRGVASVVVIDRSDRGDIAELTERLGVARVAGRDDGDVGELLTTALRQSSAELVAIVPADHVVLPDLTAATASAFDDPEVAVVVARVEPTNAVETVDIGRYGERAQRETLTTPRLDDAHALPWWFGVSVARRDALEQIGGFASSRLRPTLATGVRLQVGGWRMADVPVVVARRLAPANDSRQLHRASRDFHERLEISRRTDISWSSTRITPTMRLAYASAAVPLLRALQLVLLLVVLLATAAGLGLPLAAPGAVFVSAWLARVGLGVAARWQATHVLGFVPWITSDLLLASVDVAVAYPVLRRRRFDHDLVDVAPGSRARDILLLGIPVLMVGVLCSGILDVADQGALVRAIVVGAGAWVFGAVIHARWTLRRRQRREGFHAVVAPPIRISGDEEIWIVGASTHGVDVISSDPLVDGAIHEIDIDLPRSDDSSERFEVPAVVRRTAEDGRGPTGFLRFALMGDDEMDRLIEFCAVVSRLPLVADSVGAEAAPAADLVDDDDERWVEQEPESAESDLRAGTGPGG